MINLARSDRPRSKGGRHRVADWHLPFFNLFLVPIKDTRGHVRKEVGHGNHLPYLLPDRRKGTRQLGSASSKSKASGSNNMLPDLRRSIYVQVLHLNDLIGSRRSGNIHGPPLVGGSIYRDNLTRPSSGYDTSGDGSSGRRPQRDGRRWRDTSTGSSSGPGAELRGAVVSPRPQRIFWGP